MKTIITILIILISTQVYAQNNKSSDEFDPFGLNLSEKESILVDETKKVTAKKEKGVVVFSLQIRDNKTSVITEQIDLQIDEKAIDVARKLLKIIQTYQEDR